MKIIRLTAENVKKLKVVDITPIGNFVQVTGKNGAGKTSVLDSIWWALGGKEGIQNVPIRSGEKKARIRLDLGEFVVERKFTPSGTTITVSNADGAVYPSPQAMLDALLGELSFDPLAFSRMVEKDQLKELRRISKLDTDIDALDAANKVDFTKRTDINRQAKAKRAQADGIVLAPNLPKDKIDESELLNQIQSAAEHNTQLENCKYRREQADCDVINKKAEVVRLQERAQTILDIANNRIADLKRQIESLQADAETRSKQTLQDASTLLAGIAETEEKLAKAKPLPEPIHVSALRSQLDQAKMVNLAIDARERRNSIISEAKALDAQAAQLTESMEIRDREKVESIQRAEMPIDGLGFGDGYVVYAGVPFKQASDAEQLRVSCSIAMAANPKLRVMRVRDGSLLDDDGLKLMAEMANAHDYQIWLERVDGSKKVGIVMEDGEVVADNQIEMVIPDAE